MKPGDVPRNESPTEAAMYDILNDWYPCGHGRVQKR